MRRLKRFVAMAPAERRLLLRALFWVGAVRVGLWILPLRVVRAAVLKSSEHSRGDSVDAIVRAVRIASRYCPRASCLTQALAAQALLAGSDHRSRVEIGFSKDGETFAAHAWLVCDERIVLGGPDVTGYEPLAAWEVND
ncbi:MAG: lasso peptide biosynthesis B2 protein [Candidatus Binataceae bacterium]